MAEQRLTREKLYELVWARPMNKLAADCGMTGGALAGVCRRANVPTPPPGYWQKLEHGKAIEQPKLPDDPQAPAEVILAAGKPRPKVDPEAVAEKEERRAATEAAKAQRPHPLVREWSDENARARRDARRNGWGLGSCDDLDDPIQQRRLRLYTSLFHKLERNGFALEKAHRPDQGAKATKANETIEFRLYQRQRKVKRPLRSEERDYSWNKGKTQVDTLVPAGDLVLKLKAYLGPGVRDDFRDEAEHPLEEQLDDTLASFEAGIEVLKARTVARAEAERARWDEQRARWKRDEQLKAEAARRERLLALSRDWTTARELRAFVQAVGGAADESTNQDQLSAWMAWALVH